MKHYPISVTSTETIEFRASENTYALVHHLKAGRNYYNAESDEYKTIILNQAEVLRLYQAIKDELLKGY